MYKNKTLQELKEETKEKILKRVADKILEKENADFLIELIEKAQNTTEVLKISALGMTYKRTGFHFDVRLEKRDRTIKYFAKNEELSFAPLSEADSKAQSHTMATLALATLQKPTPITHKLIIGDNYPALLNLLINYKKKIKVIYIDPPYGKDNLGEFAKTNYDNAITRDNLLSMLYPRLSLARQLLKEDGVIFCSIDDRNQAYVKGLFDEVFGEGNFVCNFIWHSTSNSLSRIRVKTEYILCYEKIVREANFKGDLVSDGEDFPILNEVNEERILEFPPKTIFFKTFKKNIKPTKFNKMELLDELLIDNEININKVRIKAKFKWTQEKLNKEIENKTSFIIKSNEFSMRYIRQGDREIKVSNVLDADNDVTTNIKASNEVISIFDKKVFDYPKPVNLIKHLLKISTTSPSDAMDLQADSIDCHDLQSKSRKDKGAYTNATTTGGGGGTLAA